MKNKFDEIQNKLEKKEIDKLQKKRKKHLTSGRSVFELQKALKSGKKERKK